MGFANEILDAIEIMVRQVVENNTTKIYTGVCKTTGVNNCVLTINGKDNTVKYYGDVPVVGTVYQVFIPFGNMSAAFIIVPGSGGGDKLVYVLGTPVAFTLTGWDSDVQGTTYSLKAEGYKIGVNGVQIGLPSNSSTVNTQAVVAAALTIVDTAVTAPDTKKNVAGYVTITISAVTVPDRDITVAIFGLEEAEPVTVTTAAIGGVTVPVTGQKPVKAITECEQYTGTVEWSPEVSSTFAGATAYTATITLTPKPGYKLTGVAANFFTVAGAASVSNDAGSGVVTAVFPATGEAAT